MHERGTTQCEGPISRATTAHCVVAKRIRADWQRCNASHRVTPRARVEQVESSVLCTSRFGQLIKMRTSSSASSFIGTVDSPDYQNPGPPFGTVAITGGPTPSPADRRSTGRIPASWVPPGLPPGVGPQQARPEAHQMERPAGRPLLWPCLCLWVTLLHHDRLTGQSPVQCLLCTFSNLELEPSPCRCQPCQARVKFRLPSAPST